MFITIQNNSLEVRKYTSKEEALKHSILLNKSYIFHPAFSLYDLNNGNDEKGTYLGELDREFGTDNWSWRV